MSTILVVDDDTLVRQTLARLLRPTYPDTYEMESAEAAESYLEAMSEGDRRLALLLLDVSLHPADKYPDGCAAGRTIIRRFPEVRLLIISGHDSREWLHRCPGMVPWLMKPMRVAELLGAIEAILWAPPWTAPIERRKGDAR